MDDMPQNSEPAAPLEANVRPQDQLPATDSVEESSERSEAKKRKLLLTLMRRMP